MLEYLKCKKGQLSHPKGPLPKVMPSSAIESANAAVENVISQRSQGSGSRKGIKHTVYSSRERTQIGKLGCTYGPTVAAKYYKRKTGIKINESTVCSFKKACVDERQGKRQREEDLTVTELHPKKRGRKLLLGKKLDTAVQYYVLKLREYGCPVDTYLVVAAAKGITQAMDRTRLAEAGGPATLTISWAKSLLKRMNFTKRRVSTK